MTLNALSVDVEEYYHGVEFNAATSSQSTPWPSRVAMSVPRVLDLLGRYDVRATFFVVGMVAEAHPDLVKRIGASGHEIACHSYRHELVTRQSPEEFRADVRRGKAILEDLSSTPVIGYRAPNYSIGRAQSWAHDILLEEGFLYDSSVYPIFHDRYGDPNAPRFPFAIRANGGGRLMEFPIGTTRLWGLNFPIGGGGYFRLFPTSWTRRGIQRVNRQEKRPVMFYFHPWELDPGQPRPPMPPHHRFRHFVNLDRVEAKLETILSQIGFATAREVLKLQ